DIVKELSLVPRDAHSWIEIICMALDPSSSLLAFGIKTGGMIQVYDIEKKSWHLVQSPNNGEDDFKGTISSMTFLDSDRIVVRLDNLVRIPWKRHIYSRHAMEVYDWRAGKVLLRIDYQDRISEPAVSADGRYLAFGDNKGITHIWDMKGGQDGKAGRELLRFPAHVGMIDRLVFTPDGRNLVTIGDNVKVWELAFE
ncbi:MAG: WD40 repeat domain-containing protein, partial [Fimbriiglobus sp.]